jgi:anti-anti-sigma factor
MPFTLEKEMRSEVAVVRCHGRIVAGEEIRSLQQQLYPLSRHGGKTVLDLADVSFIDSAGVGALVGLLGLFRSHGCELILCRLSPQVERVLQITNLVGVLPCFSTEEEAARAPRATASPSPAGVAPAKCRIVCADSSRDVLEYLTALLKRSGYDVLTARHPSDALTMALVTCPQILVCGPSIQEDRHALQKLQSGAPKVRFVLLPPDFSTSDAGEAGSVLIRQIEEIRAPKGNAR